MRSTFLFGLMVIFPIGGLCQIGVKTRHPMSSGSLVVNQTYTYYNNENNNRIPLIQQPVIVDRVTQFMNETRSKMLSGVCIQEVLTSSLVHNAEVVPAGNGSDSTKSRIQVCCPGYERNAHVFRKCDPVCRDGCPNGICVAPDTCVCYLDHVRNLAHFCIPTCPIGCGNGECQPDGSCVCKAGFVLDESKKFCVPHCSHGCLHGNCTAPDTCSCNNGFQNSADGSCEPKCDNCLNGKCTAPGACQCNDGYVRNLDICEPVCTLGCSKGTCTAPDVCTCKPGFELDKTGSNCVPHCDKPCLNGYCDGHNVCSCNSGYIQDELQPNLCKPHCAQGCPNGYCTSPNLCLCKPGYRKSGIKGRNQCIPI